MIDLLSAYDVVAGVLCGEIAYGFYNVVWIKAPFGFALDGAALREIIFGSLMASAILRERHNTRAESLFAGGRLLSVVLKRGFVALALLLTIGLATRQIGDLARLWLLVWSALFALCVLASRVALNVYIKLLVRRGALREAIAIVNLTGSECRLLTRLSGEADIVTSVDTGGFRDMDPIDGESDRWRPSLEKSLEAIMTLGREGAIDAVVVAFRQDDYPGLLEAVGTLKAIPVQIVACPSDSWGAHRSPDVRLFGGLPMSVMATKPISFWNLVVKAIVDKIVAVVLLLLAAPIVVFICVALMIDSPGPILFRQRRSGWQGSSFVMFKFRTMRVGSAGAGQTRRGDARCTRVGAFLRRCSLDELPQLLNVLRGDMSMVGPRPHVDALHTSQMAGQAIVAEYAQRYRVKPGITGWAQVNGFRGAAHTETELRRRVEHDLFYIENWSLRFDIWILFSTPFAVLFGRNAF